MATPASLSVVIEWVAKTIATATTSTPATRRVADGLAGVGELHALVAAHAQEPAQVAVGIETDRGLLVGALVAAGYQVYAVDPQIVSRYRGRHQVSRAKSDRGGCQGAG